MQWILQLGSTLLKIIFSEKKHKKLNNFVAYSLPIVSDISEAKVIFDRGFTFTPYDRPRWRALQRSLGGSDPL